MVIPKEPESVRGKTGEKDREAAEKKGGKSPREAFRESLIGRDYDEQQDLLSPDTSPVMPSNLVEPGPEVPAAPPGPTTDVDNPPAVPGTVLAQPGPTPVVKARVLGFKTPAKPTTKKPRSKGWRTRYRTSSYLYRKQKDVVGKAVLYGSAGKATTPTKANQYKGIELDDPKQNQLEECYLVAGLSALVKNQPQVIKDAIKPTGKGAALKYQVTLYEKKGKAYSPVTVTVDSSVLYAKVKGTHNVGSKKRPKKQGLYNVSVFKGGKPVAEGNNFLPSGFTVRTAGTLNHPKFAGCEMDVSGIKWLMDASGTNKAGPKSAVMKGNTPKPTAKWPNTYKLVKDGLERVGVESTHKDAKTGLVTNELWPVILEKAIAQMLGGYQQLFKKRSAAKAGQVLSMLTGKDWDADRLQGSQAALKKKIIGYHKDKRPMIALCEISDAKEKALLGLEKNHYYAILDIGKMGASDILDVKLRDPRGADSAFGTKGIGTLDWSDFYKHFTWVASGQV